jgi:hypothetical protein
MRRGPYQPSATATAADDNPKAPDDYLTDDLTRSDLISLFTERIPLPVTVADSPNSWGPPNGFQRGPFRVPF